MAAAVNGNLAGETARPSIMDRSVCLSVEFHKLGVKKKVCAQQIDTDADRTMLHVSKDILESDAYKKLCARDAEIRKVINARCLPSMFKSGMYLLPVELLEETDAILVAYETVERPTMVETFIDEYQTKALEAESRLGSLFNAEDYPSTDKVRAAFSIGHRYMEFSTPGRLRQLNRALFEREANKMQASIANATEEIQAIMRANMADLVDHMLDRLAPTEAGEKPKIFRDSMIGNIRDFLATFQSRNIVDDQELAGIVARAGQILDGISPAVLRERRDVREEISGKFREVKASLDAMMTDRPKRVIDFDNE